MKLFKNIFIAIALIFIVMASCKKYPDGPLLSLRTKEHRVVGQWIVNYFSINGYDSTEYLKTLPYWGFYIFSKEKEGRATFSYNCFDHIHGGGGEWRFINNKRDIEISHVNTDADMQSFKLGIFDPTKITTWEIRRLKEDELWLKGTYTDGREYFIKCKSKVS